MKTKMAGIVLAAVILTGVKGCNTWEGQHITPAQIQQYEQQHR